MSRPVFGRFKPVVTFLLSLMVSASVFAETIVVGGVGSLAPMFERLAKDYSKRNPEIEIRLLHPPIGTSGGMRALADDKLDIVLAGRELKPGETGQVAPWVQTPLVFASSSHLKKGLNFSQISDIYARRTLNWDDGKPIRPVLRGAQESETLTLRSIAPEIDAAVGEALKQHGLPIAENDLDALETLQKLPGSFGTTSLGLIKSSQARLQILAVNGQLPDLKSLENGNYPWRRIYYLVTKATASPTTKAFVAYLNSSSAMTTARSQGYLPASK